MYVCFQSSSGEWSVGRYNSVGLWIHESDHDSKTSASHRAIFLNGKEIPQFDNQKLTLSELIDYLEKPNSDFNLNPKMNLTRLKNIVKFLSNLYIYTEQISKEEFLKIKNSGILTWYLFCSTTSKLKSLKSKNLKPSL